MQFGIQKGWKPNRNGNYRRKGFHVCYTFILKYFSSRALEIEEEYINKVCEDIIRHKPNVVITEKGVSDLAQHFLVKAGISVIRRLRKTDCLRIGRCTGATIVSRTEEIKEEDIGTRAGLFEVKLIGDEYFTFITGCKVSGSAYLW